MPPINRHATVVARRDAAQGLVEASLASDTPYSRYGYSEILVCTPEAVDLSRCRDGLPLLMYHDRQQVAGRVYNIRADGRQVRGQLQFFDTAAGREGAAMVTAGHRELSVGYTIDEATQTETGDIVATHWTLLEVSVVAVPADATVGIARNFQDMTNSTTVHADNDAGILSRAQRRQQAGADGAERQRVSAIAATGASYQQWVTPDMVRDAIDSGHTVDQFNQAVMARMQSGVIDATSSISAPGLIRERGDHPDLTRGYSLERAILAELDPAAYLRSAGREKEVTQELRRGMAGINTAGILVPMGAFITPREGRRDMLAGTAGAGGNTVSNIVAAEMLVPALRSRSVVAGMGAKILTGLTGQVSLPRVAAGVSVGWKSEVDMATETDPSTAVKTLTAKRATGFVDVSRQLLLTSGLAMETLVRQDLQNACMFELDRVALVGTGSSNEPTGIRYTGAIGSVVGGTNGATLTWAHVLELERGVDDANGMIEPESCGYVINGSTRSYMKRTPKVSGVAEGLIMGGERIDPAGFGVLNGYKCGVTAKLPKTLTKGSGTNLSMLLFGDFSQVVMGIFGGGVEIIVDPYSRAKEGLVEITANLFCDVAVRQPASFSIMEDAALA